MCIYIYSFHTLKYITLYCTLLVQGLRSLGFRDLRCITRGHTLELLATPPRPPTVPSTPLLAFRASSMLANIQHHQPALKLKMPTKGKRPAWLSVFSTLVLFGRMTYTATDPSYAGASILRKGTLNPKP